MSKFFMDMHLSGTESAWAPLLPTLQEHERLYALYMTELAIRGVYGMAMTPQQALNDRSTGLKQDERTTLSHMIEMMHKGTLSKEQVMKAMGFEDVPEPPPAHRNYRRLEVADDGRFIFVGAQAPVPTFEVTDASWAVSYGGIDPATPADDLHTVVVQWAENPDEKPVITMKKSLPSRKKKA